MGKYKKEWDRFIVKYFQNNEYASVERLWLSIIDSNSQIYNIYEQTIKCDGTTFVANRSKEIGRLIDEYDVIRLDFSGNARLSDRLEKYVKRNEKIEKLKK